MAMETGEVMFKSGAVTPATDNPSILTVDQRDPLLEERWRTDELAPVSSEVIRERRMDTKSEGAHGISNITSDKVIRFGRFSVVPQARQLLIDGQPIQLGSRAFDLLMVLIRAPGALITKAEMISRVWPDRVVEESNLKMQMSALRRVLNADRDVIKTIHGRGYVFTSKVTTASSEPDALAPSNFEPILSQLGTPLPTTVYNRISTHRQSATGSGTIAPNEKANPVIVVIDDDPDRRAALKGFLGAVGLCVESFSSTRELLDNSPADISPSGCSDKATSRLKRSRPRQSCARRSSSAATPISLCRFE